MRTKSTRGTVALLVVAVALLAGIVQSHPASADYSLQVTAGAGLHLRTGPGLDYEIITTMPWGSVVDVSDQSGDWLAVTYAGIYGWAYDGWLGDVTSTTTASTTTQDYSNACAWAWGSLVCAPYDVADAISGASATYGVSYDWLLQVAACESNFDQSTPGSAGEVGIFQFLPSTWYDNAWPGADINSVYDQANLTAAMFAAGESNQWTCAR